MRSAICRKWWRRPRINYAWRPQNNAFLAIGVSAEQLQSGRGQRTEQFPGAICDPGFFAALGVAPIFGRTFTESESHPGQDGVVVLGYGVWKTRFGGDGSILGKPLDLNGRARTVIGVMPPDRPCWRTRLACRRSRFRLPCRKGACRWPRSWRGVRMKTNYCWIWRCGWRKRAVHGLGHNE